MPVERLTSRRFHPDVRQSAASPTDQPTTSLVVVDRVSGCETHLGLSKHGIFAETGELLRSYLKGLSPADFEFWVRDALHADARIGRATEDVARTDSIGARACGDLALWLGTLVGVGSVALEMATSNSLMIGQILGALSMYAGIRNKSSYVDPDGSLRSMLDTLLPTSTMRMWDARSTAKQALTDAQEDRAKAVKQIAADIVQRLPSPRAFAQDAYQAAQLDAVHNLLAGQDAERDVPVVGQPLLEAVGRLASEGGFEIAVHGFLDAPHLDGSDTGIRPVVFSLDRLNAALQALVEQHNLRDSHGRSDSHSAFQNALPQFLRQTDDALREFPEVAQAYLVVPEPGAVDSSVLTGDNYGAYAVDGLNEEQITWLAGRIGQDQSHQLPLILVPHEPVLAEKIQPEAARATG